MIYNNISDYFSAIITPLPILKNSDNFIQSLDVYSARVWIYVSAVAVGIGNE